MDATIIKQPPSANVFFFPIYSNILLSKDEVMTHEIYKIKGTSAISIGVLFTTSS